MKATPSECPLSAVERSVKTPPPHSFRFFLLVFDTKPGLKWKLLSNARKQTRFQVIATLIDCSLKGSKLGLESLDGPDSKGSVGLKGSNERDHRASICTYLTEQTTILILETTA